MMYIIYALCVLLSPAMCHGLRLGNASQQLLEDREKAPARSMWQFRGGEIHSQCVGSEKQWKTWKHDFHGIIDTMETQAKKQPPAPWKHHGQSAPKTVAVQSTKEEDECYRTHALQTPFNPSYDYGLFDDPEIYLKTALYNDSLTAPAFRGRSSSFESLLPFGDHAGIIAVMKKLSQGESVNLVVLGGSEPAGCGCEQRDAQDPGHLLNSFKGCSWPARFSYWLQKAFPNSHVNLNNFAMGGTDSKTFFSTVGVLMFDEAFANADLVFLDTLVNDVPEATDTTHDRIIGVHYEQLVRVLRERLPGKPIFSIVAACPLCKTFKTAQRKITDFYMLPGLDLTELVKQDEHIWDDKGPHPTFRGHQYIADLLAISWSNVWKSVCANATDTAKLPGDEVSYFPKDELNEQGNCAYPLSAYLASSSTSMTPEIQEKMGGGGNWRLYEDRKGKPGWIAEAPGSLMKFPLSFGNQPRIIVTYLKSYENLGKARLTLNGVSYDIDGIWPAESAEYAQKVSQSHTQWFWAEVGDHQDYYGESGLSGFGVPRDSNQTLTIELLDCGECTETKMKILAVVTC